MPKLRSHIGVPVRNRRVLITLATMALSLVVAVINLPAFKSESSLEREKTLLQEQAKSGAPLVLPAGDLALYRNAFMFQQAGKLEEADDAAAHVTDPLLKGVLLGERYLAADNQPSFSELALWLSRYSDHAQANQLYKMARQRAPGDADFLPEPQITATLKGFSNGEDGSDLQSERDWVSGIAAFRRHDMTTAAAHFKALLKIDDDSLSSDDRAAAAFWAYRASIASGDTVGAARYVAMAAEEPPSFYSIIARQVMGEHRAELGQVKGPDDINEFLKKSAVRRAVALKAIGQDALAEKELRCLFPASSGEDRKHLVELARMLNLPAAQMRMAVGGNYEASGETQYPLPHWTPTAGFKVEPALLFAIMRQESGFNPNAHSASGAIGVMQLMPATASAMAQDTRMKLSGEPGVSMALGQHYLERLMDTSAISDNFVYLIAAYNAGPGNVAIWQKNLHVGNDPLLFIESMPKAQTRDYVVHVMGNYWVYSELMGGHDTASVAAFAANQWPHYERSQNQMVSMVTHLNESGAE